MREARARIKQNKARNNQQNSTIQRRHKEKEEALLTRMNQNKTKHTNSKTQPFKDTKTTSKY